MQIVLYVNCKLTLESVDFRPHTFIKSEAFDITRQINFLKDISLTTGTRVYVPHFNCCFAEFVDCFSG